MGNVGIFAALGFNVMWDCIWIGIHERLLGASNLRLGSENILEYMCIECLVL